MSLEKWFQKGLTSEQYKATLEKHKEAFHHIYKNFTISNDGQFLQEVESKNLRAIVLAEPWCGHCMLDIPIFLRLAEKTNMSVKFLLRDENLTLMDQYLTNGKSRTIPIMIFIDENGDEVAKWGPIADNVKQFVSELMKDLPEKDAPHYEEEFRAIVPKIGESFRNTETIWTDVYESIKETLQTIQ